MNARPLRRICLACLNVGKTLSVRTLVGVISDMVVEATR